jgi:hypothetical protein
MDIVEYKFNGVLGLECDSLYYFHLADFDKYNRSSTPDSYIYINSIHIEVLKKAFKDIIKIANTPKSYKEDSKIITFDLPCVICNKQGKELFNDTLKAKLIYSYTLDYDKVTLTLEKDDLLFKTIYTPNIYKNDGVTSIIFSGIVFNINLIKVIQKRAKTYVKRNHF